MEFLSKEQKMKILDKIFGKDEVQGENSANANLVQSVDSKALK